MAKPINLNCLLYSSNPIIINGNYVWNPHPTQLYAIKLMVGKKALNCDSQIGFHTIPYNWVGKRTEHNRKFSSFHNHFIPCTIMATVVLLSCSKWNNCARVCVCVCNCVLVIVGFLLCCTVV